MTNRTWCAAGLQLLILALLAAETLASGPESFFVT